LKICSNFDLDSKEFPYCCAEIRGDEEVCFLKKKKKPFVGV